MPFLYRLIASQILANPCTLLKKPNTKRVFQAVRKQREPAKPCNTLQNPAIFCKTRQNPTKPDIFRLSCFPVNGDLTAKQFGSREESRQRGFSEETESELPAIHRRKIRKFRLLTGAEQAIFADSGPENGQNANIC